jgi:hypothetical protein
MIIILFFWTVSSVERPPFRAFDPDFSVQPDELLLHRRMLPRLTCYKEVILRDKLTSEVDKAGDLVSANKYVRGQCCGANNREAGPGHGRPRSRRY